MASSVAFISDNGLLTVDNQFQGIRGKTTKGEITTYVEKNHLTYSGHELILGNEAVICGLIPEKARNIKEFAA